MAKLTYNVVIHELSRYEGRQILPKMLFMAVVWVFVDFSRSVTPQIFVHSRIDRFPRLVNSWNHKYGNQNNLIIRVGHLQSILRDMVSR